MANLLHELLAASASDQPERPAVFDRDRMITYRQLDERSNRLAHLLIQKGVGPGDRVGLYLDKSLEAVVGIYATLKAGAVYVPLDSRAPAHRLAYIAADCGIRLLITASREKKGWPELISQGAPLTTLIVMDLPSDQLPTEMEEQVDLVSGSDLEAWPSAPPGVRRIDEDLAYILYTSGSTGAPKGVMLSHRNALAFVEWAIDETGLTCEDRLSSHAPFHFDLSIFDLYASCGVGASVTLVPRTTSVFPVEVAKFIDKAEITVWYSVPSILSLLIQHANLEEGALPSLRTVVFAGEVFPSKYLATLMKRLPHAEFHNWYGPTETNVCTAYRVPEAPDPEGGDIPIGRAISNVETYVMKSDGSRAAPGEEGELFVRGATVMHGYWGDPEKTAARLLPNPTSAGETDLAYATGDLVVELESGDYRFVGRKDHQIKSRGYRIELGEIETALYAHTEVLECAVVALPDEVVSNRIWAYVVVGGEQTKAELAKWCAERVPKYMIPERFELLDRLPKTSTGKIDRQALHALTT